MFSGNLLVILSTIVQSSTTLRELVSAQTPPDQQYWLRTCVINGSTDCGTCKDSLYVSAFHTHVGTNDAVLVPQQSAVPGYLNGTSWLFNSGQPDQPYSLRYPYSLDYTGTPRMNHSSSMRPLT
jgi:hypothetical protein